MKRGPLFLWSNFRLVPSGSDLLYNSSLDRLRLGSSPWRGRSTSSGLGSSNGHKLGRRAGSRGRFRKSARQAPVNFAYHKELLYRSEYKRYESGHWNTERTFSYEDGTKENQMSGEDTVSSCITCVLHQIFYGDRMEEGESRLEEWELYTIISLKTWKRPLGRPWLKGKIISKRMFKKQVVKVWLVVCLSYASSQ